MAFLKNDADIILDAVLTDVGRERLARGDGSFNVVKYAFGDDEINYELHDSSAGTAYADLNILKTPILEAMTNNKVALKNQLITMQNMDNQLYLPILKLNTNSAETKGPGKPFATGINADSYVVACTTTTVETNYADSLPAGFIDGRDASEASEDNQLIKIEQGLDTTELSFTKKLSAALTENIFHVHIDSRLGTIVTPAGEDAPTVTKLSSENNIDHYVISRGISGQEAYFPTIKSSKTDKGASVVAGPRAEFQFKFGIRASDDLVNSTFLFTKFGRTITGFFTSTGASSGTDALAIDTTVKVVGQNFGYGIDIPVRFVREP